MEGKDTRYAAIDCSSNKYIVEKYIKLGQNERVFNNSLLKRGKLPSQAVSANFFCAYYYNTNGEILQEGK